MEKLQELLRDLIVPFLLMLLIGVVFTIFFYYSSIVLFNYDVFIEDEPEKRLDGFTKIVSVSVSITGFLSIIITIIQSKKGIQREIQKNTIDLFKEFRSEKLKAARDRAWDVKEKWTMDENYRIDYLKFNYDNPSNLKNEELSKDTNAIYDLLEFYLIVAAYGYDKQTFKAVRYFYYGWWRPFLYEITEQIEKNRNYNSLVHFYSSDYVESISYTNNLEKLDKLCGFEKIPKHEKIHYDGG